MSAARNHAEFGECLSAARHSAADDPVAHGAIGDFCSARGDYPAALDAYDEAVQLDPLNPRYRYNRAAVRRFLGELEGAEADLDSVIAASPNDAEAWHLRSDLRVQTADRNHVVELELRSGRGFQDWRQEVQIRFALAKEYEDLGQYRDSWRALHAGSAVRRKNLKYDVRVDLQTVDWIREAFPAAVQDNSDCEPSGPIFIVGMPRTGTTLLERILGRHCDVHAAGELADFAVAVVAAAQRAAGRIDLSRPALIAASARANFAALGADYLARTGPRTGNRPRFVDKMPLNYLYCGLIRRALPNARILHVTRHPLATCYAGYKTLFAQGYPFSYDLMEIADYYAGYRRLMAHWHQTLPGQILDVSYERLITDPAGEAERVFEFCGLKRGGGYVDVPGGEWQTTTASASQVRRPIYRTSIDLWRHYAVELAPVSERLAAAGIAGID